MQRNPIWTALTVLLLLGQQAPAGAGRQMENLTRGIVAVKQPDGVYVGWRLFGTDPDATAFHLYRITEGGPPVRVTSKPSGKWVRESIDPGDVITMRTAVLTTKRMSARPTRFHA